MANDDDEHEDDDEPQGTVGIHTLSDAALIHILQRAVGDESFTHFIEAEIARRKLAGGALQ
jgi:hypothetical protein